MDRVWECVVAPCLQWYDYRMARPQSNSLLRNYSVLGTGLRWMSYQTESDSLLLATQWVTLCYFPLVPLRRRLCQYQRMALDFTQHEVDSPLFLDQEKATLDWGSVLATYGWATVVAAILFGPIAFMIAWTHQRAAQPIEIGFIMCWIVLVGLFPFWRAFREKRYLESTRGLNYLDELQNTKDRQAALRKQSPHRYADWIYLLIWIVAGLPGFLLAERWGLNLELQKLIAVVSGLPVAALVYWADRKWMQQK